MDSFSNMNFARYFILWMLLLLSPIYSNSIYSSKPFNIRITETIEETITLDCSPTTTSSTTTPCSTSSHDIISGFSTAKTTIYVTSNFLPDATKTLTISTPSNATSTSRTSPSMSLTSPGTSLTSYGISLTSYDTSLTSYDTSLTFLGTSSTSYGMSLTSPGTSLTSPGTSLTSPGTSLISFDTSLTSYGTSSTSPGTSLTSYDTSSTSYDTSLTSYGTSSTSYGTFLTSYVTYSTSPSTSLISYGMSSTFSGTSLTSYDTSLTFYDTSLTSYGTSSISYGTSLTSYGTSSTSPGTSLISYGTSPTSYGTSLTSYDTSLTAYGTSSTSYGTSPTSLGTPLASPGTSLTTFLTYWTTSDTSLAISGTPWNTPGRSLTTTSMTLTYAGITISSTMVTSLGLSALPTQSEIVLPGASAITIEGIPVSLGFSGTLVIGTSTLTLPPSATEVFTIGSQPVTIAPTGFGVVLPPHTSPLPTAPGTVPISLGQGGMSTTVTNSLSSASLAATTTDSITSTMTTIPPGFSTEASTNTLWTTNIWFTTVAGGIPTIVPVLVGCPGCGGIHGGIILWNLPEIPWVSFQFPGFPGLPKFHLPCIKIFGLVLSGDCNSPPSTDGDNDDGPSQSNPSQSAPSSSNENPSSTLVKSSSSTQTSASSTEACILTEVACTQTCTVSSISGGSAPTTSCGSPGLCRRQAGGGECTSTTGTITSTSFTTASASASAFICKAGSCAAAVCGISVLNIAPAITTNATGDQIPSLANLPNPASKRSHRRIARVDEIIKRVPDPDPNPDDPTSLIQLDFTDPNSFYKRTNDERSPKQQWYQNAQEVVIVEGARNQAFRLGGGLIRGFATSKRIDYADVRQKAITTGSGPSWGCTSVLVYSERGAWIAHFWEQEQMQAADFNGEVLNFIRSGDRGRYEGLDDVIPSLFSGPSPAPGGDEGEIVEVPVFSGAVIFTPSFRENDELPPASQRTDPLYSDKVNRIKTVLVNRIPGFTLANMNEKINVAIYKPAEFEAEIKFNPWFGLLTFEYVPQHVSNDNNACEVLRAIRIHVQDNILDIITWNWPDPPANPNAAGSSKSKNKRQGACPVNLLQILSAQGDGTAEPASFFDISTPVSGVTGVTSQVGPASASGSASAPGSVSAAGSASPSASPTSLGASLAATTSSPPPAAATTTVLAPSSTAAGPVLCSNWELSPNGVQVGTDCDGDPNETVTVMVAPGKRAVKTIF